MRQMTQIVSSRFVWKIDHLREEVSLVVRNSLGTVYPIKLKLDFLVEMGTFTDWMVLSKIRKLAVEETSKLLIMSLWTSSGAREWLEKVYYAEGEKL